MTPEDRQARSVHIRQSIERMKGIVQTRGVDRASLADVLEIVKALAAQPAYWSAGEFAPPELPEQQARYLISAEEDHSFTLYLNVFRPGKPIPPHNHTTWACVAAVEGSEYNHLYRRTDDGSVEGVGRLEKTGEVVVAPGHGIALMPEDIHRVEIRGDAPIRHLHMYGQALETLSNRVMYDLETGQVRRMGVGVTSRRPANLV